MITIFKQVCRQLNVTGSRFYQTQKINNTLPSRIVNEVRIAIDQNPVRSSIHGAWLALMRKKASMNNKRKNKGKKKWKPKSFLKYLVNDNPSPADETEAQKILAGLPNNLKSLMDSVWKGRNMDDDKFREHEFKKHSMPKLGAYDTNYFKKTVGAARPFLAGGHLDIIKFMKSKYKPGVAYSVDQVNDDFRNHVSAVVKLVPDNGSTPTIREVGILHTRNLKKIINHPAPLESPPGKGLSIILIE